jgi:aminoglycoside phosphotransferase (APT) family kinase protein
VVAYVKLHWDAAARELDRVAAAAAAIGRENPHLRLPHVLAASLPDGAVVLEPLPGRRLDALPRAELAPALRALGAGLAALHSVPLPARRFDRLDPDRLVQAAALIGRVRPDCRRIAAAVLAQLVRRSADAAGDPVHVHGDANLRNALLSGDRIALVDLEDAAAGPAAADLGFVLAGLLAARAQDKLAAAQQEAYAAALLGGYGEAGRMPVSPALRWHTAASVLARVAVPAVGRVRPGVLARLEPLLRAAGELVA